METKELIKALKRISLPAGGELRCLGCEHEDNCGVHGCIIIRDAIEKLEESSVFHAFVDIDEIKNLPPVLTQEYISKTSFVPNGMKQWQKWIPVSDRLPADACDVLTCHKDGRIERNVRFTFGWVLDYSEVTHWMPLPDPPKSEN